MPLPADPAPSRHTINRGIDYQANRYRAECSCGWVTTAPFSAAGSAAIAERAYQHRRVVGETAQGRPDA